MPTAAPGMRGAARGQCRRGRSIPSLAPNPTVFAPAFEEELSVVRQASCARVRHDLLLAHAPASLPEAPRDAAATEDAPVARLRDAICDLLRQYWEVAIEPMWPQMRLDWKRT
ncbi:hypothetical protein GCM10010377_71290 [Streptomyces viridiviolaceus]|nr:hypothetical protein GCM10010377_71290 [Streptomyces viridiviolaceus]